MSGLFGTDLLKNQQQYTNDLANTSPSRGSIGDWMADKLSVGKLANNSPGITAGAASDIIASVSQIDPKFVSGQPIKCYPNFERYRFIQNLTKIEFNAKEIKSQAKNAREKDVKTGDVGGTTTSKTLITFQFIMPTEIVESISHSWEAYDSSASKIAEAAIALSKMKSEVYSVGSAIRAGFKSGGDFATTAANVARGAQIGTTIQSRLDIPLVYKNSERRKFEFTFNMGYWNDPKNEMIVPIKTLASLSCARLPEDSGGNKTFGEVFPPCAFEIKCDNDLIYVKNAALLTVQPTYRGPFRNGWPSSCELHLSFEEIEPLWNTAFSKLSKKVFATETTASVGANKQSKGASGAY